MGNLLDSKGAWEHTRALSRECARVCVCGCSRVRVCVVHARVSPRLFVLARAVVYE